MIIRAPGDSGWIASAEADVRAVLTDERFSVAEIGPPGADRTIAWLRATVSRFVNGPAHTRRRSTAVAELSRVNPGRLRAGAGARALGMLCANAPGAAIDVMAEIARRAPAAALAALLGADDPDGVALAVVDCAAGYFPGAEIEVEARADAATGRLLDLLAGRELDIVVARITLLVQACEATAGLIGMALCVDLPTDEALAEVLRRTPPVRVMRRVANAGVRLGSVAIRTGDPVLCDIDAASDPGVLAFGDGVRACPGSAHGMAAAAGVVDAVRASCVATGGPVECLPAPALRVPRQVRVVRRPSAARAG